MRLSRRQNGRILKSALGGIRKTKQSILRATSRKHLSLQSAISYLGFGSPRRCAGDGDIGSRLCIPLEVAQVEVVGSQFHSTCQAHLIAKVGEPGSSLTPGSISE